ncbi:MAG TPA: class I SAM-dependent methyltransferase [Pedobacter sp.]|uniref:class I SAM-dependent methyltransferase n=1 Tax=Pedobacter sp. TaxID=1411316 RepID=UPI002C73E12F|nr:class I SAM-dependent methyltransferase [Pedobacter sp.]HMI02717.1 class I SAM-dependent methyltransferase [Pedobacter sp.]
MKKRKLQNRNQSLYNSTIFNTIYKKNHWGGSKGEFYSGPGSHNQYVEGYSKAVSGFILKNNVRNIIEIGCGDFNVSQTLVNLLSQSNYSYSYTGYDVVKSLIARNKEIYSSFNVSFRCKDCCTGNIKEGDLLIIRQVLQHLNNKSIWQVVNKFKNYKYIIVTEHQASESYGNLITPNKDIITGASTRLEFKSGVYLDKEPFNCGIDSLLYSIPEYSCRLGASINTYLIKGSGIY